MSEINRRPYRGSVTYDHAREEWEELLHTPGIEWDDESDLDALPPTDWELDEATAATEGILADNHVPVGSADYGDHIRQELARTGRTLNDIQPRNFAVEEFSPEVRKEFPAMLNRKRVNFKYDMSGGRHIGVALVFADNFGESSG